MAYGKIKADSLETSTGTDVDLAGLVSTEATTSAKGYMSSADKTKMDGLEGLSISYPSGNTIEEVIGAAGGALDETFTNGGSGYEVMVLDYGGGEYAVILKLAGSTINAVVPHSDNGALNNTQVVTLTWNGGANTNTFIPNTSTLASSDTAYRFDMWSDPNANPSAADDEFVTVNISSPPAQYVFNNGADAQNALVTSPSASGKIDIGGTQYNISDFTDETLADGKLTVKCSATNTIAGGDTWREVPNNEATEGLLSYADAARVANLPNRIPFYETGVWVPRFAAYDSGNYTDFYSHTMTLATGRYQRIGNSVTVTYNLLHPAGSLVYDNGSATERVYIADLPYEVGPGQNYPGGQVVAVYDDLSTTFTGIPAVRAVAKQLEIVSLIADADQTNYIDAQDLFKSQSLMTGSITYFTDDTTYTAHATATVDV